eukprot:Sspe_Gene.16802::Locus_5937_Transcript_1_1_Confidence_1.000_Length_2034::g.16802::m.16802
MGCGASNSAVEPATSHVTDEPIPRRPSSKYLKENNPPPATASDKHERSPALKSRTRPSPEETPPTPSLTEPPPFEFPPDDDPEPWLDTVLHNRARPLWEGDSWKEALHFSDLAKLENHDVLIHLGSRLRQLRGDERKERCKELLQLIMATRSPGGRPAPEAAVQAGANAASILTAAGVPLTFMDLRGVNLRGAMLDGGHFEGTDFNGANLAGAYLRHTNLRSTQLYGTDLTGAHFGRLPPLGRHRCSVQAVGCGKHPKDNGIVASGSQDETVRLWRTGQWGDINESNLRLHAGWVMAIDISKDAKYLVTGGKDSLIRVTSLTTESSVSSFEGHKQCVRAVSISPDSKYVVSSAQDYTLKRWELATGRTSWAIDCLFNDESERPPSNFNGSASPRSPVSPGGFEVLSLAHTSDGSTVVAGCKDGYLRMWRADDGTPTLAFQAHAGAVAAVAILPGANKLVTGGFDDEVKVWDLENGDCLQTLMGHDDWVRCVACSPDGSKIVSGGADSTVRVWDASTGRLLQTLTGHDGWVMAVAVTSEGDRCISGGADGLVLQWPLADIPLYPVPSYPQSTSLTCESALVSPSTKLDHTAREVLLELGACETE